MQGSGKRRNKGRCRGRETEYTEQKTEWTVEGADRDGHIERSWGREAEAA